MQRAAIARPRPLIGAHLLLLLAERRRHGYELAESLRLWEFEGITTSTVYRELARLEEDGLVQSFWEASQARGPARHMYELTESGRADLASCAEDVRELMSHLVEFLSRFSSVDRDGARAGVGTGATPSRPTLVRGRARFWKSG